MKKGASYLFAAALLCAVCAVPLSAQTSTPNAGVLNFDRTEFPQWAQDLRRADIVAFGAFPFAHFLAETIMDTYRWASHDQDTRYAPWPFKPAGAVTLTKDERVTVIWAAAITAVAVAVADYFIVQHNRRGVEAESGNAAPEDTITVTPLRPLPNENEDEDAPDL
jgi:hypothetical protein